MNSLENIKRFYFIGIGGIGMSALARFFFSKGYAVAGYDKTPSDLTDQLMQEGIEVHFEDLGVQDAFDPTYSVSGRGGDGSTNLACFGPGSNLLNGRIAEVLCYGGALTAQQILQNFNATKTKFGL